MSIKVTTQPKNRISVTGVSTNKISVGISTKDIPVFQFLRNLRDVNSQTLSDNATVVYESGSDKFVVKELPIINGGTF